MFLAGDAAHQITPRGGTGMNTAVHDGYDLGWKLAWVLLGRAGPPSMTGMHRLDAATADLLGVEPAGALLPHPDGRPAAARELLLQQAGAGDLRR